MMPLDQREHDRDYGEEQERLAEVRERVAAPVRFSPQPWRHDARMDAIVDANGETVATPPDGYDEERWAKDAPLIASAPDLLAALRTALDGITSARRPEWDEHITVSIVRAAIAKANGQ